MNFDLNIWKSLRNKNAKKSYISYDTLEQEEVNLMNSIREQFKEEVYKRYNCSKISFSSVGKNTDGLTFYAKCGPNSRSKCKTVFRMKINVRKGKAILIASIKCAHM